MLPNSSNTNAPRDASVGSRVLEGITHNYLVKLLCRWGSRLEKGAREIPIGFAVAFVTLLFALTIWAMPPAFQTNDDAIMCMIVSGQGVSLAPDEHIVFTNVIIAKILKSLYVNHPGVHWYGWYLVATQWISTVVLLYCFLRPRYTRLRLWGFTVYFLTFGIYFLVNLQFTATANMSGVAGGLILIHALSHSEQNKKVQLLLLSASSLLLIWAGLIRGDAYVLAVALILPTVAVAYWLGSGCRRTAVYACLALAVSTFAMLAAESYHKVCYDDPVWQVFYEYNRMRVKFNDEQWVVFNSDTQHVFDQVGWTKNDYDMIANWFFDDEIYDIEKLEAIWEAYPWMLKRDLGESLSLTISDMSRRHTLRAMFLMLPAMLILYDWRKRRSWTVVIATLSSVGLLLAITVFKKPPPERVYMPIMAFPWLMLLNSLSPVWRTGELHRRTFARVSRDTWASWRLSNWTLRNPQWRTHFALRSISLMLVFGLSINIWKYLRVGFVHEKEYEIYQKMLADFRPDDNQQERLVLTFGADFPFEYQAALFGSNDYSMLHFYSIGWPQRTPFAQRVKQHYKIESLGKAMSEKHDMLVVVHSAAYGRILEYLAAHYSSDIRIKNLKGYTRSNLSMIEPRIRTYDFDKVESPILFANPQLEPKGLRR